MVLLIAIGEIAMQTLHHLFSETQGNTKKILDKTSESTNSLAIIFRTSLEELLQSNTALLHFLKSDEPNLKDIKEDLSIVYHDDGISYSTFRAWKRALKWQGEVGQYSIEEIDFLFQKNKKNFEDIADTLTTLYDRENLKYVVPESYFKHAKKG